MPSSAVSATQAVEAQLVREVVQHLGEQRIVFDDQQHAARVGDRRAVVGHAAGAGSACGAGACACARAAGGVAASPARAGLVAAPACGALSGGDSGGTRGMSSRKVLPWPGSLSSVIVPPSSRASSREIDRPSPVPPNLRLVVPSAWRNASKMICWCSAAMPMPVSRTANSTCSPRGAISSATSPRSVNLSAFDSRFFRICDSRCASVSIAGRQAGRADDAEEDLLLFGDRLEGLRQP